LPITKEETVIPYILIVVALARGGASIGQRDWPVVTFQCFGDVKACQSASAEIAKRLKDQEDRLTMVCVPEVSK